MRRLFTTAAFAPLALLVAELGTHPTAAARPQPPAKPDPKDNKPTRRALLVGVSHYPKLAERFQLVGPANDVVLMKSMLVKDFAVPAANVVTLSEADGAKDAKLLPTKANIEREFKHLAEVTRPGDEVIVLLGGHGSQQPEGAKAKDPELDGLDEIFLPRDVGKWSDGIGSVENAITDDELGAWVTAIYEKNKAFVWLVIDACHSGTMMRGGDDAERPRKVDPLKDLGINPKAIEAAEAAAAKRAGPGKARGTEAKPTSLGLANKPGVFAIYAAQPTETTPERPMPPGEKNGTQHGVLTFTVCQTLSQARAANSPISYRELGLRIHQQYAAWGRTSPTPMVEFPGADPDREVLGPGVWKDRANILLTDNGGGNYTVNAGQLTGLTAGSVLQVLPPPGMGDEPLGHVKVTNPKMIDADVAPVAFGKMAAPKALPNSARCKVVYVDYGDVQLRVAVAKSYPSSEKELKPIDAKVRDPLVAKLKDMSRSDSLFRLVDDPKDAAWLLAPWPDGKVSLMPAAGLVANKDAKEGDKSRGFGPVPTDDAKKMEEWLNDTLGRIARAEGLINLAGSGTNDLLAASDLGPKIKVEVFYADPKTTGTGLKNEKHIPLPWPATDLTMFDMDKVRVKVTNTGRVPIDLTALYLDSDYGIDGLWPSKPGTNNRVGPGEPFIVPFTINAKTAGTEHLALIALKASGPNVDFLALKQKAPDKLHRGEDGPGKRLGQLLSRQVYKMDKDDKDSARGASLDVAEDYTMALVTWKVKGEKRPAPDDPKK